MSVEVPQVYAFDELILLIPPVAEIPPTRRLKREHHEHNPDITKLA